MGEFKTNFILPNYIGIGNGITRGFGTIYGMFNPETFSFDKEALIEDANDQESEPLDSQDDLEIISASEVPKPKRNSKKVKKEPSAIIKIGNLKNLIIIRNERTLLIEKTPIFIPLIVIINQKEGTLGIGMY